MAITISNPVNTTFTAIGAMPKIPNIAANPAKTFIIVCPAIIFAKRRTAKLRGLERYEINSIGTNSGSKNTGNPCGANLPRNFGPCITNPKTVTNRKTNIANVNVAIIWLVNVNM